MFSPSDNSDNRPSINKDNMRFRKLLEKEFQLGTTNVVLSWNGISSKKLEIRMNPADGVNYDQTIVNEFISQVEAKRSKATATTF
jgi:hypothetical protein